MRPVSGFDAGMAKEIERKFLVEGSGWRALAGESTAISQFYVAAGADRSVRIRIKNGETAKLTLKFGAAARERDEFEYPIPLDDARAMQRFAIGRVIEKTRHEVVHRGRRYEIDTFGQALAGLVIAELETPDEVADDELPPWLGREVTGEAAFYNAALAMADAPGDE